MDAAIEYATEHVYVVAATAVVGLLVLLTIFRVLGGASSASSALSMEEQIRKVWSGPVEHEKGTLFGMLELTRSLTTVLADRTVHKPGVLDDFMFNPAAGSEAMVAIVTKKQLMGPVKTAAASSEEVFNFTEAMCDTVEDELIVDEVMEAAATLRKAKKASALLTAFGTFLKDIEACGSTTFAVWKGIRPDVVLPAGFQLSERLGRLGEVRLANLEEPLSWEVIVDVSKRTAGTVEGDSGEIVIVHRRRDSVVRDDKAVAELVWEVSMTFDNQMSYPLKISSRVQQIHVTSAVDEGFVGDLESTVRKALL